MGSSNDIGVHDVYTIEYKWIFKLVSFPPVRNPIQSPYSVIESPSMALPFTISDAFDIIFKQKDNMFHSIIIQFKNVLMVIQNYKWL